MLYDFESTFSEERKKPKAVRKDSVLNAAQRKLRDLLCGENKMELFTLKDAKRYFLEMREKYPQASQCTVSVVRGETAYEILQILLDSDGEPLRITTREVAGRKVLASELGEDVQQCLGEKTVFRMKCAPSEMQL